MEMMRKMEIFITFNRKLMRQTNVGDHEDEEDGDCEC